MNKSYILIILFIIIVIFILLLVLSKDRTDKNLVVEPLDEIALLTNNLIQAKKDNNLADMVKIATERKDKLINQVKDNPQAFLSHATLSNQKQGFPDQVQPYIEEGVELQGKLIVVILDDFENKRSFTESFLEVSNDKYQLYFTQKPPDVNPGSIIKVKGILLDKNVVVKI